MPTPNKRERDIIQSHGAEDALRSALLKLLAEYREELLKPFDELHEDCVTLHDASMAKRLREILVMLRGEP